MILALKRSYMRWLCIAWISLLNPMGWSKKERRMIINTLSTRPCKLNWLITHLRAYGHERINVLTSCCKMVSCNIVKKFMIVIVIVHWDISIDCCDHKYKICALQYEMIRFEKKMKLRLRVPVSFNRFPLKYKTFTMHFMN